MKSTPLSFVIKSVLALFVLASFLVGAKAGKRHDPDPLSSGEICRRPKVAKGRIVPYHVGYYEHNIVVIICHHPYLRVGPVSATCRGRGVFSRLPKCVACENNPLENGFSRPGSKIVEVGRDVKYGCNYGYTLEDEEAVRTCEKNGTLKGPEPVCKRNPTCERPVSPFVEIKSPIKEEYEIGEEVLFKCKPNQVLKPENATSVICRENGRFNGTIPVCVNSTEPAVCKRPESLGRRVNIRPRRDSYQVGKTVRFVCADGQFSGDKRATCLGDGTFNFKNPPKCKAKHV